MAPPAADGTMLTRVLSRIQATSKDASGSKAVRGLGTPFTTMEGRVAGQKYGEDGAPVRGRAPRPQPSSRPRRLVRQGPTPAWAAAAR